MLRQTGAQPARTVRTARTVPQIFGAARRADAAWATVQCRRRPIVPRGVRTRRECEQGSVLVPVEYRRDRIARPSRLVGRILCALVVHRLVFPAIQNPVNRL